MGQTVVLDSGNLDAIVADATGEPLNEKPAEVIEEPKVEAKVAPEDDTEGEDGLTPREKRELTAKMQKAIAKRTVALRDAEEFAAEQLATRKTLEAEKLKIEAELAELKSRNVPRETSAPQRQNFKSDQEYTDALIDYRVDQKLAAERAADAKRVEQARQAEVLAQAKERIAAARELVPDFDEVTEGVDWKVPPVIGSYMQESEMFAELGYYLAQNEDVRRKLEKLPPGKQLVEIGKIESNLQPFADRTAKAKSNGHAPSKINGSKPSVETDEGPSVEETAPRQSAQQPRTAPIIRPLSSSGAQVEKPVSEMNVRETINDWSKKRHVNFTRRSRH